MIKKRTAFIAALMAVIIAALIGYQIGSGAAPSALMDFNVETNELRSYIKSEFYKDVDDESLTEGALKGMVAILGDQYSGYMTAEEYAAYMQQSEGLYAGVGVVVSLGDDGYPIVMRVYANSPASSAGMQVGDRIVSVNGEAISGTQELSDITAKIKGEEGTQVTLGIERGEQELSLTMTRMQVQIEQVESQMLEGDIGYIRLYEFAGECVTDFKNAITDLTSQGAKALVIDLRDNPGGFLSDAVDIADMLLPKGTIVYTEDKNGNRNYYYSDEDRVDVPMAVLINSGSASASEILAGAIQDYKAATIIGTTSFGKGIVQKLYPIASTGGALKLTNSTYYTPNGRSIHGKGITPDITEELPEELIDNPALITKENDTQLQKAVEVLKEELK